MLQYEKIDVSKGIGTNKIGASKKCIVCHYWYSKDVGFKLESHVFNKCYNVLMIAYELKKNIAKLNVKVVAFRSILWGISRNEAVNRLDNSVLEDKCVL